MTLAEALDVIVSQTRHERYRWLCSDDNPDQVARDAYRAYVFRAAGEPLPPAPERPVPAAVAERFERLERILGCPHFSRPADCGCRFGVCGQTGKPTTFARCDDCLCSRSGP
jgi:hypothetical protein